MDQCKITAIVDPFIPKLLDCLQGGCQDYLKHYRDFLHIHTKRTRASITRDHIKDRIRRNFATDKSARIIEKRDGLFLLELAKQVLLRFKKLNSRKCSSNIPTTQAKGFYRQLPMIEGQHRTNLNAGYIANETWTGFEFYITEPSGSRSNAWVMAIHKEPLSQSIFDITPVKIQKPKRITAKTVFKKKPKGADNESTSA